MTFRRLASFIILYLLIVTTGLAQAQSFDYESYPPLNFGVVHMDLDLALNPDESRIQGAVSYEMEANVDGADTLILHASDMQVNTVSVDNGSVDFRLRNDSLLIGLTDPTVAGRSYNVSVTYEATPRFGLLKNNQGTVWTSLLPRSVRHWVPIIDHPRVSFSSNLSLTVPSGYEAAATGMQMDRRVLDVDNVVFTYRTEKAVPASALSFAIGNFEKEQTSFGLKRILLLAESGILPAAEQRRLMMLTSELLRDIQNSTEQEFPFEGLNIVVLSDHYWETKSWGASTIFLYLNRGDLEAQLQRGLYGQWFGVYQREEQWREAEAVSLYQTMLHYEINDQPALLESADVPVDSLNVPYATFDVPAWNRLQNGFFHWTDNGWKAIVSSTMSEVLKKGGGVFNWGDYARFWYEQSGQPYFDARNIQYPLVQDTTSRSDSVSYRVDYLLDEMENRLVLRFNALKGGFDELVTLPLIRTVSGQSDTSEVTFTGTRDSVIVNMSPAVQNIHIDASSYPGLLLEQYQPAPFLIYALRNGETIEERREAARKLGYHSDDPDLQLAIRDFLKSEELHPEVRAALLESLANITKGANGTEQTFIDAVSSVHPEVQLAGLMALQYYPGNNAVQQTAGSYALESDSLPIFKEALQVFSAVTDTTSFDEFIRQVVRSDTAGYRAIYAIQEWAKSGQMEKGVRQAEFYTDRTYDYPVRVSALQILFQYDHTPQDWKVRATELLEDGDPRIRFLVVRGLLNMSGLNPAEVIIPRFEDEYDARVYGEMQKVINDS